MKKRKGRWQVWPGETFTVTWDDGSSTEFPRYVDFHGQRLNFEDLRRRVQAGDEAARAIWGEVMEQMYRGLVLHLTGLGNELRRLHGLPEEEDVTPQQMMALMDSNGWRDLIPGWARAPGYDEQQP